RESVYSDIVALSVVVGGVVLAGPRVEEIPTHLLLAGVVELDDRAVPPIDLSIQHCLVPVVQLGRIRQSIFQGDVGKAELAGKLAHRRELAALAVLHYFDVRPKTGALQEPALHDSINLDQKPKILVGIHAFSSCHTPSLLSSLVSPLLLNDCLTRRADDPEDHKLSRSDRRHADLDDQLSQRNDVRRVQLVIDPHSECFVRRCSNQSAIAPDSRQEVGHLAFDGSPQSFIVRLKHRELSAFLNRFFYEEQQPPDVDVTPLGDVRWRDGSGAPDQYSAARKRTNHVDTLLVERTVLVVRQDSLQIDDPSEGLIGGRLEHPARFIGPGKDTGDVP